MVSLESCGPNQGKCYLILNKDNTNETINLGKKTLHAEAEWKLHDMIIDKDLIFQSDTKSVIKIINQKLSTFMRVTPFMTDLNKKDAFNYFIKCQLIYPPLLRMFSIRTVNHGINRFHERGLRALLNDKTSTVIEMLSKINYTTIHVKIFNN